MGTMVFPYDRVNAVDLRRKFAQLICVHCQWSQLVNNLGCVSAEIEYECAYVPFVFAEYEYDGTSHYSFF